MVIVLSGSDPYITSSFDSAGLIDLTSGPKTVRFRISDLHGNALPVGTTVAFSGVDTELVNSSGNLTIGNTIACMKGGEKVPATGPPTPGGDQLNFAVGGLFVHTTNFCPDLANNPGVFDYSATIKRPTTTTAATGFLKLTVKTPKDRTITYSFVTQL